MNRTARNTLTWIVIIMMAMLPLRAVIAMEQAGCDMQQHHATAAANDHAMHMMHGAVEHVQVDSADTPDCCEGATHCSGDCGMGTGFSFIVSSAIVLPSSAEPAVRSQVNDHLVRRDISPPTRPPAYL